MSRASKYGLDQDGPRRPSYGRMTPRRLEMLDFLRAYIAQHGQAPTNLEIRQAMGITSSDTVHNHLKHLEAARFIVRHPHVARGIQLLEETAPETALDKLCLVLKEQYSVYASAIYLNEYLNAAGISVVDL